MALDPSQERALDIALHEPISIITGGPGVGKTFTLGEAIRRLHADGETIEMCAPTGKAAKRIKESTGKDAQTIHRLLKYHPHEGYRMNARNPLDCSVVIVDEFSMVDIKLFAALLDAIHASRTRLILVGDANQLPSVGPGKILADLVESELVPCARLTKVHRSKARSWVCQNAPKILKGHAIDLRSADDFGFVDCSISTQVVDACIELIKKDRDTQVLVPQKTGKAGCEAINLAIQKHFNPQKTGGIDWGTADHPIRKGDKVIHMRNDYDLFVFNGETGVVVDAKRETLHVQYEDRTGPIIYDRSQATSLRLAYALTIHKSQGSQWPHVAVIVHSTHTFMLTRQLIYTAVTRAQERVTIVGDGKGINAALRNEKDSKRNTALCERIKGV